MDALRTVTSYFDKGWNAFAQQKDGSMKWIPEQIVGIGEHFHNQVDDDKVKTTLYKVRWSGYDKTGDTWEPIIHLQGYASMVKEFKESHEKDVERLSADRRCETEAKLYICTLLDLRFKKFDYWPTRKYVNNSQLCTECI